MTRHVVTAVPETPIAEVAELMLRHQVGSVVIVDPGDRGRVVGIVTETDFDVSDEPIPFAFFRWPRLFEEWVWSEDSLEELYRRRRERPISTMMKSPVTTTDAGTEIWEAVSGMLRAGVHHMPVLEDGRLAGILARHDLLKLLSFAPLEPGAVRTANPAPALDQEVPPVFERIVCGADGSSDSLVALRQALALRAPEGHLIAVTARYLAGAIHAGATAPAAAEELDAEAAAAQERATQAIGGAPGTETRLVDGRPLDSLLAVVKEERATLLAIGTPPGGRLEGMMLGHVASSLLHQAPCPVLVGRRDWEGDVPRTVVAGFDGSEESVRALAVARAIGERFGSTVRVIVGKGGKSLDDEQLAAVPGLELDDRSPADTLVAASEDADLLVIGSRGLHGFRALGSVSEKVAHRAESSVLVVRPFDYGE